MGFNAFSGRDDDFLESEVIKVEASVSDDEESNDTETKFNIIKVIDGDNTFKDQPFWVRDSEFVQGYDMYNADLKVNRFEKPSIPDIKCISIYPTT